MKHRVAAKKGVACKEEGNVSAPLLSPQPLPFWPKLADTAGHRQRAPAVQTMSSSMGSVRSLSSKFHADTCNIDDVIAPSLFGNPRPCSKQATLEVCCTRMAMVSIVRPCHSYHDCTVSARHGDDVGGAQTTPSSIVCGVESSDWGRGAHSAEL